MVDVPLITSFRKVIGSGDRTSLSRNLKVMERGSLIERGLIDVFEERLG